jgi:peptide-methionine (S)-S-oxide reductase
MKRFKWGIVRLAAASFVLGAVGYSQAAEEAVVIPAPAVDQRPSEAATAVAVFAGGCFWGVQGVYQHVKGVLKAVSGYAGGAKETASYEAVGRGDTGHAEAVQITYDPTKISYGKLLQIFFSVAHDPTQLDRQGPDHGPEYRSTIFPTSAEQREIAEKYIAQLEDAKVYPSAIVTTLEDGKAFYPAEAYHQDFLVRNPRYPYIVIHDLPKVASLAQVFPAVYRDTPVLVYSRGNGR